MAWHGMAWHGMARHSYDPDPDPDPKDPDLADLMDGGFTFGPDLSVRTFGPDMKSEVQKYLNSFSLLNISEKNVTPKVSHF